MTKIDFYNVESLIFDNADLKNILTEYEDFFNYYFLYKRIGDLNKLKKLKIDFLNLINIDDLTKIRKFFKNDNILVQKMPDNITKSLSVAFDSLDEFLSECNLNYKDFCLSRTEEKILITFWR